MTGGGCTINRRALDHQARAARLAAEAARNDTAPTAEATPQVSASALATASQTATGSGATATGSSADADMQTTSGTTPTASETTCTHTSMAPPAHSSGTTPRPHLRVRQQWHQRVLPIQQELLIQVLQPLHHHTLLTRQEVTDMDQLRISIQLHLQGMQVLQVLLWVQIHHMMLIVINCINTLTVRQPNVNYIQVLSSLLFPRPLMVLQTLNMVHLSLMDTVLHLKTSMISSIKVPTSRFYQTKQKGSRYLLVSDFQLRTQPFANSPGTVINGMTRPSISKHL